ncbi:BamA/TamA family outer membrane protein [candidate division KSB1 bacterium]
MKSFLSKIVLFLVVYFVIINGYTCQIDEKFRVDKIEIFGNGTTQEYVILREMIIQTGDSVTDDQIEIDRKRISNLGIFERVQIEKDSGDSYNILKIFVTERWYIFPVPLIDIERRDLKRITYGFALKHFNFRGRAEQLTISAVNGYRRGLHVQYRNPWYGKDLKLFNNTKFFYKEGKSRSEELETYTEISRGCETLNGKRFGLYTYTGLILFYKDISVSGDPEDKVISPTGRDRYSTANVYVSYDNRDLKEYPTTGWKSVLSYQRLIWSDPEFSYAKMVLDLSRFQGLFKNKIIFAVRSYFNYTFGDVARYNRVYLGYTYKIRGHFLDIYEGDRLIGGTFEFRIPFGKPAYYTWKKAPFAKEFFRNFEFAAGMHLFFDYGRVWELKDKFKFNNFKCGAGIGFHFRLPYDNLLRLDFAYNGNNFQFVIDRSFLF